MFESTYICAHYWVLMVSPASLPSTDIISFLPHSLSENQELFVHILHLKRERDKKLAQCHQLLFGVTREVSQGDESQELRPQGTGEGRVRCLKFSPLHLLGPAHRSTGKAEEHCLLSDRPFLGPLSCVCLPHFIISF